MLQSGDYEHQIVWAEYDLGDKLRASKAAEAALTAARTACENAFSGAPSHRRKALRARLGIYDASALVLHDNWPGMSVEGVTYPREDWVARLYATCVGSESGIELIEVLSSTSDPSAFVKNNGFSLIKSSVFVFVILGNDNCKVFFPWRYHSYYSKICFSTLP